MQEACKRRARGVQEAGAAQFVRINRRIRRKAMVEFAVTGLLAWWGGQPGQVGNEAATAVFRQCRGSGSSPSFLPRSWARFHDSSFARCCRSQSARSGVADTISR
ncbi:protein of unknown function [Burkholderia multivorans]